MPHPTTRTPQKGQVQPTWVSVIYLDENKGAVPGRVKHTLFGLSTLRANSEWHEIGRPKVIRLDNARKITGIVRIFLTFMNLFAKRGLKICRGLLNFVLY